MDETGKQDKVIKVFVEEPGFAVYAKVEGLETESLRDVFASWIKNWLLIIHDDYRLCKALEIKQPIATKLMMLRLAQFGTKYEKDREELVNGKKKG